MDWEKYAELAYYFPAISGESSSYKRGGLMIQFERRGGHRLKISSALIPKKKGSNTNLFRAVGQLSDTIHRDFINMTFVAQPRLQRGGKIGYVGTLPRLTIYQK
jgi:hypothetical protein